MPSEDETSDQRDESSRLVYCKITWGYGRAYRCRLLPETVERLNKQGSIQVVVEEET